MEPAYPSCQQCPSGQLALRLPWARCGGPREALASADAHTLQVLDSTSLVPKDPPKVKRRVRIPDKPNYSLNLWSIMKNCIGRELSKIPMPVGARAGQPHWVPWGCFLVRGLEVMAWV